MKTIFSTGLLVLALGLTSAHAAGSVTLSKKEAKAAMSLITGHEVSGDCKKDSDCGKGEICVGIGICVPEDNSDEFKSKVPSLFKR